MAEVKKQEFELLETQSVPMRHYLMKYVMPTVMQGLMDCCKVKPDDPVDFLVTLLIDFISHVLFNNYSILCHILFTPFQAEYLFRNNSDD